MAESSDVTDKIAALSPKAAAWKRVCPRCGEGKIYNGLLSVKDRCDVCALDLHGQDTADGPAFFVITIMGALIVALPALVEWIMPLPFWMHAMIWLPLLFIGSLWMLRFFKAWMIALEYKHGILSANNKADESASS